MYVDYYGIVTEIYRTLLRRALIDRDYSFCVFFLLVFVYSHRTLNLSYDTTPRLFSSGVSGLKGFTPPAPPGSRLITLTSRIGFLRIYFSSSPIFYLD